jgi:serine/threonine protein kinase
LGEVVAALAFLHDFGFSYGDLKPENVLLTERGHLKVRIIIIRS